MEILCAYVRKNAGPPNPLSDEIRSNLREEERVARARRQAELRPFVDVQVALTVIGADPTHESWKRRRVSRPMVFIGPRFSSISRTAILLGWISKGYQTIFLGAHLEGANLYSAEGLTQEILIARMVTRRPRCPKI